MRNSLPFATLLIFLLLCVALRFIASGRESSRSLPEPQWAVSTGWADESRCADCHFEQSESFRQTGHARTLQRANKDDSLALLEELAEDWEVDEKVLAVSMKKGQVLITHRSESSQSNLRLDWCFGSGEHARTWVGTVPDSWGESNLVEFRWSWFHRPNEFGITPGQPERVALGDGSDLGLLYDTPKARRCFSCHSTVLPQHEEHTEFDKVHPGVTCQRCHGPRQKHVESGGEIQEGFWRTASRLESVRRCGECHRIAEDQDPGEIDPENPDIVRFQPVGLVQSPCFLGSKEMTCLTCHDPHRPLSEQNSTGIQQCVQCHDGSKEKHALCSAGNLDDCLSCHMPKVRTLGNLEFTDHWIRIRNNSAPSSQ